MTQDFQMEMCFWILQGIEWDLQKLHEICFTHDKDLVKDIQEWVTQLREEYENEL